jgi:hypothetical protein
VRENNLQNFEDLGKLVITLLHLQISDGLSGCFQNILENVM